MRIAVNTRFLLKEYLEGYGYFIYETFNRIVRHHPEHEFIFIFDRPFDQKFIFAGNVKPVVIGPPARHPILWKFWYDVKIPVVLKKYKADVFVSCDGFCSLRTDVPQCLVLHDLSFIHFPAFNKKSHVLFYKRYTPKFLEKASSVVTVSEFSKKDILLNFKKIPESKLDVAFSAVKEIFQPADEIIKKQVKEKYTNGKEFFICIGAIHPRKNPENLLKAFSVFKKRQQSNMKLLMAGRLAWKFESFLDKLKRYKYRDDVVLTGYLDDVALCNLLGSAYAMVYPSLFEGFGVPVLEAMCCEVPVITSAKTSMQEIAQDAALYCDPNDFNSIAEKMMVVYKDENLREKLIKKGKRFREQFSWDRTAEILWQNILKAVG
ncbi:MAG: glycosyltransferase family 4 protein [Bacteroidetes bacterium]|nr:glycosyltransferase family 4 protein [Bacteroidota bacterium]MBS1931974.1 glycosyltransferase family 4 protein [Bacteroidota bacterium]